MRKIITNPPMTRTTRLDSKIYGRYLTMCIIKSPLNISNNGGIYVRVIFKFFKFLEHVKHAESQKAYKFWPHI